MDGQIKKRICRLHERFGNQWKSCWFSVLCQETRFRLVKYIFIRFYFSIIKFHFVSNQIMQPNKFIKLHKFLQVLFFNFVIMMEGLVILTHVCMVGVVHKDGEDLFVIAQVLPSLERPVAKVCFLKFFSSSKAFSYKY